MSAKEISLVSAGRFTSAFVPVVKATEVSLLQGGFSAIVYQCKLNVDFDGAPTAYGLDNPRDAAPAGLVWNSDKQKYVRSREDHFQRNLKPLEYAGNHGSLRDATDNVKDPRKGLFFDHDFKWVGVVSANRLEAKINNLWIDDREILRDRNSRFPVIQKDGPTRGYYVSQSGSFAISPDDQKAPGVKFLQSSYWNASEIPYCVWPSMLGHGVTKGDFGLVISNQTGSTGGFFFADTGSTTKLGECSMALAVAVANSTSDTGGIASFIVFPRSGGGDVHSGQQTRIQRVVQANISKLADDPSAEELIRFLAMGADPDTFSKTSYDSIKSGKPAEIYDNVHRGLKEWGFKSARKPIDPNAAFIQK